MIWLIDREVAVNALSTAEYPTKAKRPAWSVLDKSKIVKAYGVKVPEWEKSLAAFLDLVVQNQANPEINRFWSN
jgi:dTDP-4-dehydrorhamnose reductase